MKTMAAGEFKAKCLGLLGEVKVKRTSVRVTKNGKLMGMMVPPDQKDEDPLNDFFIGGEILGDVMAPAVPLEDYEALK
jgi:hypothetical protein